MSLVGEEERGRLNIVQSVADVFRFHRNGIQSWNRIQRNARLEEKLEQLVEDARVVAKEKRIFTETEARERQIEREQARARWLEDPESVYWGQMMQNGTAGYRAVVGRDPEPILCRRDSDCGGGADSVPHGICASNRCSCVKGFSGTRCTHSVHVITGTKSPYPVGFSDNPFRHQLEFELFDQCMLVMPRRGDDINTRDTSFKGTIFRLVAPRDDNPEEDIDVGPSVCRWRGDQSHDCSHLSYIQGNQRRTSVLTDEFQTFVKHHLSNIIHDSALPKRDLMNPSAVLLALNMCTHVASHQLCDSLDTVMCQLLTRVGSSLL